VADPYYSVHLEQVTSEGDDAGRAVLRVAGELDINARDDLHEALATAARPGGCREIVVDLEGVAFLDSEAINPLITGLAEASAGGVAVRITGARGLVHRVLSIAGVFDLLERLNGSSGPDPDGAQRGGVPLPPGPAAEE
jgi:anti-anti-sigma factor